MLIRVIIGAALLIVGYYVGKQVGRGEPIRASLKNDDGQEHDVTNKSIRP